MQAAEQVGPVAREVLARVDALAAKLGIAADHIYAVYLAQARVEFIRDVAFLLTSMVLAAVWCAVARTGIKEDGWFWDTRYNDPGGPSGVFMLMGGVAIACFLTISVITAIVELPTLAFNPEFWVMQQIAAALH